MGVFNRQPQSGGLCRLDNNCNNSERSSKIYIKTNSAPPVEANTYHLPHRRTISSIIGHHEINTSHFWISVLKECLSCYIYVFIVCSTRISWTGSVIGHEPNLLAMALSSGISMLLLVLMFSTVHVNPSLTVAFLLTGRIPFIRAIVYILVHCIGAVAAVTSLYSISVKGHAGALGLDNPHFSLDWWQICIVEMMISFVVTLATYATCNYSSYTSARKFILEQAVAQNDSPLFSEVFPTAQTCDNIPVVSNNGLVIDRQRADRPNNSSTAPFARQLVNSSSGPAGKIHPHQRKNTVGGFLTDIYANEELNSEYDVDYETSRIYGNSLHQQYQQQHPRSGTSSSGKNVIPIEQLMQNESQLLAPNGFSIQFTTGQALVIGLAYTLTSLSGVSRLDMRKNKLISFERKFI